MRSSIIYGFSRLSDQEKREFIARYSQDPELTERQMEDYLIRDDEERRHFMEFSENTVSSFHTPYGIAPNLMVDGVVYHVPMATEESSVVAAASHSARFWAERGGFRVTKLTTTKPGQVWFRWLGDPHHMRNRWPLLKLFLLERLRKITVNMNRRGGGLRSLELLSKQEIDPQLYLLELQVDTVDSMGANFINTCLEDLAEGLAQFFALDSDPEGKNLQVVMAILSNYTPSCTISVECSCPVPDLTPVSEKMDPVLFAEKFALACRIAQSDMSRAVTHNKGIMNGIDAVLMATGNDHRAAEADAHAFASRNGHYQSLSWCKVDDGLFSLGLTLPLAVGTVGGITHLHPLARLSLGILGNPRARELMGIVAATGLASNFAAVRSLVTTGIQQGHMRLHLSNLLNLYHATPQQREIALAYFRNKKVSYNAIKHFLHEQPR